MDKIKKENFEIPEPNEDEIKKTIEKVKKKDGVTLSREDATKYTKLYSELGQWFLMEKNINSPDSFTDEMAEELKKILRRKRGQEFDIYDAQAIAKESLNILIPHEKERIATEIRALIAKY